MIRSSKKRGFFNRKAFVETAKGSRVNSWRCEFVDKVDWFISELKARVCWTIKLTLKFPNDSCLNFLKVLTLNKQKRQNKRFKCMIFGIINHQNGSSLITDKLCRFLRMLKNKNMKNHFRKSDQFIRINARFGSPRATSHWQKRAWIINQIYKAN